MTNDQHTAAPSTLPACHFRDGRGRVWDCTMSLGAAKRIDASDFDDITKIDFSALVCSKELLTEITVNKSFAWSLIWVIVQPQVKDVLGIDPATDYPAAELEFAESIRGGEVKKSALRALWEALADFFQDEVTGLDMVQRLMHAAMATGEKKVQDLEPDVMEAMERVITEQVEELRKELKIKT